MKKKKKQLADDGQAVFISAAKPVIIDMYAEARWLNACEHVCVRVCMWAYVPWVLRFAWNLGASKMDVNFKIDLTWLNSDCLVSA